MKNVSIAFNIILTIAVGILYYLHFTSCGGKSMPQTQNAIAKMNSGGAKVVFINSDSLLDNYTVFKMRGDELEKQKASIEASLQSKSEALQKDYAALMQKAQSGMITETTAQQQQGEMMKRNEALQMEKNNKMEALMKQSQKISEDLQESLTSYFKANKEKYGNYDMVIGYQKTGAFLYVNDSLDITQQAIFDLNEKSKK